MQRTSFKGVRSILRCNTTTTMPAGTIVIKKYENRRMYDSSHSRYVNLEDLAEMIRQGCDVRVLDAKTGEDITRLTLTQVIMEDAKDQPAGLPLELLRQLIVASDRARQDFLMWYLKSAFDSYQKVQEAIQNQLTGVRATALAPFESVRRFFTPPAAASTGSVEELEQLRARVAELEKELRKKPRRRARKDSKRRV